MKAVKNDSLQGFSVYFTTPKGLVGFYMKPGEVKVVDSSWISEQIKNLANKRLLTLSNI